MSSLTAAPSAAPVETLALAILVLGAMTIGFAPILVRLTETGPAAAGFWRLLFAVPLLAAMDAAVRRRVDSRPGGMKLGALAGILFAGDLAFWHYGVALTSVANATVLSNLSPIVVALMAWSLLGERPRPVFALGIVVGVAGACGMAVFADHTKGHDSLVGDVFSALTAVWYGAYLLAVNAARRVMPATTIMLYSSIVGVPILLVTALALGEDIIPASPGGWAACVGLGVVHVVGQGAIAWALGRLKATLASVVILVQPVVAAIAGALLFSETLTPLQMVAAACALGGVVIARLASAPRTEAAPAA